MGVVCRLGTDHMTRKLRHDSRKSVVTVGRKSVVTGGRMWSVSWSGLVVLWIVFLLDLLSSGTLATAKIVNLTSTCDNETEFTCVNMNCVPIEKWNNTVNDCGDNSDEVAVPCKSPGFSCHNGQCPPATWLLDGLDDCKDGTDEAKIVGTDCSMIDKCCYCEDYVPNSECVTHSDGNQTCQCSSGFYGNELGTHCIRRMIGDDCLVDPDCYNAFPNSSCLENTCQCDVGYYDSMDGTECVARIIGDECTYDVDCSTVVTHSNCTNYECACNSGFYHNFDRTQCILRRIGEECYFDHQCYGVGNSSCVEGNCTCQQGYKGDLGPKYCNMRLIDEECQGHHDCPVIGSLCVNASCGCSVGRYPSDDLKYCVLRVVGDTCVTLEDCSASMEHAYCADVYGDFFCRCDIGYHGPPGSSRCFSTDNDTHILIIVINIFLVSCLIIITGFLVQYFCQVYKQNKLEEDKRKSKEIENWVVPFAEENRAC